MHLRVGGSASNGVVYVPRGVPGRGPGGSTVVTDASLQALNDFAVRANLQVTFCFQYQTSGGKWNPGNATALWAMAAAHNLTAFTGWRSVGSRGVGDTRVGRAL